MPLLPRELWKQEVIERSDGFWINSGSGYFGPFDTREEAEKRCMSYEEYIRDTIEASRQ